MATFIAKIDAGEAPLAHAMQQLLSCRQRQGVTQWLAVPARSGDDRRFKASGTASIRRAHRDADAIATNR
jgi:hypothetical protein